MAPSYAAGFLVREYGPRPALDREVNAVHPGYDGLNFTARQRREHDPSSLHFGAKFGGDDRGVERSPQGGHSVWRRLHGDCVRTRKIFLRDDQLYRGAQFLPHKVEKGRRRSKVR